MSLILLRIKVSLISGPLIFDANEGQDKEGLYVKQDNERVFLKRQRKFWPCCVLIKCMRERTIGRLSIPNQFLLKLYHERRKQTHFKWFH